MPNTKLNLKYLNNKIMEMNISEIALIKEFVEWYEWKSGNDAFEMFDNTEEVIEEFINWKYA